MSFFGNSTLKRIFVGNISRPTGGGVSTPLTLPRTGFLSRLWVEITGSVAGTLSAPNAGGMASIVNRCRVTAQGGQDLFNLSGLGYHKLYRDHIDYGQSIAPTVKTSADAAVTATTFNVSMLLPVQLNMRDEPGLFMLQNEQTAVSLNLDWTADATVATGATVTATCKVYADIFTVPQNTSDYPDLALVHQVLEDQVVVSGAGLVTYEWPRGSIYLRMLHGLGVAQSAADSWSSYQVARNESDVIYDVQDVLAASQPYELIHGFARPLGFFSWDGLGYSGLGSYASARDTINSRNLTNLKTRVVATGAGTLICVRDTFLPIKSGG